MDGVPGVVSRVHIGITGALTLVTVMSATACRGASDPPATQVVPSVSRLELAQYLRQDPYANAKDPTGRNAVYVVAGTEIVLRGHASGVSRIDVVLSVGSRDSVDTAVGIPDGSGNVEVRMTLPERGQVYYVQASGVLSQQRPERIGDMVNDNGELVVPVYGFHVMAELI